MSEDEVVVQNQIAEFKMCTSLQFWMMVAIMNEGELVTNHLDTAREEASKPDSARKSFGLILNFILTSCCIQQSANSKNILAGKFLGGSKPSVFNKASLLANRPSAFSLPTSNDLWDVTDLLSKSKSIDNKKKVVSNERNVPDRSSPTTIEKRKKIQKTKSLQGWKLLVH
ncbi:hypothetical protein OROMI_011189 [Orobanche minor]